MKANGYVLLGPDALEGSGKKAHLFDAELNAGVRTIIQGIAKKSRCGNAHPKKHPEEYLLADTDEGEIRQALSDETFIDYHKVCGQCVATMFTDE